jgi:D-galactarolactone cycloisomerase
MKIAEVRIPGQNLPMTLVEVRSDTGLIGIGGCEAPVAAIRPILKGSPWRLADLLIGREIGEIDGLWQSMVEAIELQGGVAVRAAAALDMALWDLAGKAQGVPLYKLFGGAVQPAVMAYASGTAFDLTHYRPGTEPPFKSAEQLAAESEECARAGFRAVKFGWGDHFSPQDEDRLAAIRKAIGPDVRLMIDFGCPAYFGPDVTPSKAIKMAALLEKYDVYFLEEPLLPYDSLGHAEIAREARTLIASGEMLCHEYEFDRFICQHSVDVIQPDAYRIGVTQTLRVARKANEWGILCVPHSPWSALAVAAHVNVMASVPNGVMVEYPSPSLFRDTPRHGLVTRLNNEQIVTSPLRPDRGMLPLPTNPGLGVGRFNYDVIARIELLAAEGLER